MGQTWPAPSAVCAAVLRKGLLAKGVFGRLPAALTVAFPQLEMLVDIAYDAWT